MRRVTVLNFITLLFIVSCNHVSNAQTDSPTLEFGENIFTNPFVVEGERLEISVESSGHGVDNVNVSLECDAVISLHAVTDESGNAHFDIPFVNFPIPCRLMATKEGYRSAEINITILNRPKLHIICPKVVEERKSVEIRVVDDEMRSVSNAIILVRNEEFITDGNGRFIFDAPSVGFPMPVEIRAKKDGYEDSDYLEMWILDNKTSSIIVPLSVNEGMKFQIRYNGEGDVRTWFDDEWYDGNMVNVNAPIVNETKVFQIKVYNKTGYLLDYKFLTVLDNSTRALLVSPDFIEENSYFNVSLFSLENGDPIPNTGIIFGNIVDKTDSNGYSYFLAPEIDESYVLYQIQCLDDNISCKPAFLWVKNISERSLIVTCPSSARSGEKINMTISNSEGKKIFAVVKVENTTYYAWNGSAEITIPYINGTDYVNIEVISPGYAKETRAVYVTGREKNIYIDCPDYSIEGDQIVIKVKDGYGNPVEGASVWFDFREYLTDDEGEIEITAPDVVVDREFLIYAEKENYLPAYRWIGVISAGIGKKFMKLIAPVAVTPLEEIEVKVLDENGNGICDVNLKMQYQNIESDFKTDDDGTARILSPPLDRDGYFILTASKSGYIPDTVVVNIFSVDPLSPNLVVYTPQTRVEEGEEIIVQIMDENGLPVKDAILYVDNDIIEDVSDDNGIIICNAPYVEINRSCFIYAVKEGYNFGYTWIDIIDKGNMKEPVNLEVNDTVYEGETFSVRVTDMSGNPLSDVPVYFGSLKKRTNENGVVTFVAPSVDEDRYVLLGLDSGRYISGYRLVKVIDRVAEIALSISIPPRMMEGETVEISIKDAYGYPVNGVTIIMNGNIIGYTDVQGKLKIKLPEVDRDTTMEIIAVKSGYISAYKEFQIKNRSAGFFEENWYVIPIIIFTFMVAVFIYFYYQREVF